MMQKKWLTGLLCLVVCLPAFRAQEEEHEPRRRYKTMERGDQVANLYYGANTFLWFNEVTSLYVKNREVKAFGPIGAMYEYLLNDVVGLGFEAGYTKLVVDYDQEVGYPNYNTLFHYKINITSTRAMVRFNFHFPMSHHFDAYGLVSAGYKSVTWDYESNDPNAGSSLRDFNSVYPFGIKPGFGIRYFLTDNLGINLETAMGTPVLCGGLSWRF